VESKRRALGRWAVVGILAVLVGTVACKRSETADGTLSAPGSQIPHDGATLPGMRPGQAPDMPQRPNSR